MMTLTQQLKGAARPGRRRIGGLPFLSDPASLFTGGFTGVLFDAQLSDMYVDAGVTLANVGQSVQAWRNLAGGGLISQATAGARAARAATGLQTDGIDDFYSLGVSPSTTTFTILIGATLTAPTAGGVLIGSQSGTGSIRCWFSSSAAGQARRRYGTPEANFGTDVRAFPTVTLGGSLLSSGPRQKTYFNGVVVEDQALTFTPGGFPLFVGANNNAGTAVTFQAMTIKGLIYINRVLTDTEVRQLHNRWTA
jgi:hypothetical protein